MLETLLDKQNLFALSLFPYLGFLWFVTRSRQTPKLALIGFYVLLVFVAVTIPAGIYADRVYGDELANVDWLHGSAESFLTLSNILVVLGFRQAVISRQRSPQGSDPDSSVPQEASPEASQDR
jgi:hypothetical protein